MSIFPMIMSASIAITLCGAALVGVAAMAGREQSHSIALTIAGPSALSSGLALLMTAIVLAPTV